MKKILNWFKEHEKYYEALRYLFIGGCTTLVNFTVFALLRKVLELGLTVSNVIAIVISILFAYVANKKFVFKSHCRDKRELAREFAYFILGRAAMMLVEIYGLILMVDVFHQPDILGKLEIQIIVVVGNFIISKLIVFQRKK
jgi:putative flippase GtrA